MNGSSQGIRSRMAGTSGCILTLKREATEPAAANVLQRQPHFDTFVARYNHERPHQALAMKVPGRLLHAVSTDLQRDRGARLSVSGPDDRGHPLQPDLSKGRKMNLNHVFAGQNVGVTEVAERIWLVTFMHYDLGYFDDETCRLEPIDNPFGPKVLPMCSE